MRNNGCFDLNEIPHEPRHRWHQGPRVPFKQSSPSKEGRQPSESEQACGEHRQRPSQDPQAKSRLLSSLETQLACCKDGLSEEEKG